MTFDCIKQYFIFIFSNHSSWIRIIETMNIDMRKRISTVDIFGYLGHIKAVN